MSIVITNISTHDDLTGLNQYLTEDVGHPHLERQIAAMTTLMRASDDWAGFKRLYDTASARMKQPK